MILNGRFSHEYVDIFAKKQLSLQFFCSLLRIYIVHKVSFIFHLNVFLVSVCASGFAYLLCLHSRRGNRAGMHTEIFVS